MKYEVCGMIIFSLPSSIVVTRIGGLNGPGPIDVNPITVMLYTANSCCSSKNWKRLTVLVRLVVNTSVKFSGSKQTS